MIDIHSHVLPEIDDGSRSMEETISILEKMSSLGFHHMVTTPHYITGSSYKCNNDKKIALIKEVQEKLDKKGIDMNLFLGNEV